MGNASTKEAKPYTSTELLELNTDLVQVSEKPSDDTLVKLIAYGIYSPCFKDKTLPVKRKVQRWDPVKSNRQYRHEYFMQHGSFRGIHSNPKKDCFITVGYIDETLPVSKGYANAVKPSRKFYHFQKGRFTPAHPSLPGASLWEKNPTVKRMLQERRKASKATKVARNSSNFVIPQKRVNPYIKVWKNDRFKSVTPKTEIKLDDKVEIQIRKGIWKVGKVSQDIGGNRIITYLGGRAHLFRPAEHHKKYLYFFRKRGFWTFSEHHPYVDEKLCYAQDDSRSL